MKQIEERSNKRFTFLKKLRNCQTSEQMLHIYCEVVEDDDSREFESIIENNKPSKDDVFMILLTHYDLFLYKAYLFEVDKIADILQTESNKILSIVYKFAYRFGDLNSCNIDYFGLDNPIWKSPIIKLDDKAFFCFIPMVFFSFILPIMDELISNISKDELSKRRSEYLENKIEEIAKTRFPENNILKNFKWHDNGVEYETDLIVFIDSCIIIFEAKSGRIDPSSFRGAPKKLERDIKKLLIDPNIQSQRLKNKLFDLIRNPKKDDAIRKRLPVDLNNIHKILRVSVTLEYFAALQANIKKLKKTDWIPHDINYCPTMSLSDFEKVFDILTHPVEIIYYLEAREKLEMKIHYIGNELHLLGNYIDYRLIFPFTEEQMLISLTHMSKIIDNYYDSLDEGLALEKPKVKISKTFSAILSQLEKRKIHRWTEMGTIMYSLPPHVQDLISSNIYKIKQNVKKNWMIEKHDNLLMYIPPAYGNYALCFFAFCDKNKEKRHIFAENASMQIFENEHIEYCLIIGKNIDSQNAYDLIVLYETSQKTEE
jgi:hypothetical protein